MLVLHRQRGGTQLIIQQTLKMRNFREMASHYELRALVNYSEGRCIAQVRTEAGWAECGEEGVQGIIGRGIVDLIESAQTRMLFYKRTAPKLEYPGPSKVLVKYFGKDRPQMISEPVVRVIANDGGFEHQRLLEAAKRYPMPYYVKKLLRLPEFLIVNADTTFECMICTFHEGTPEDAPHNFHFLPCGHHYHMSCLKDLLQRYEKCPVCRMFF